MQERVLFSREQIARRVGELAEVLSRDYAGKDLLVVGVLKGAFVFLADLVRRLSIPCEVDFARLASYGAGTESSGAVQVTKDIETPPAGRDILVVEDIVDTGITLAFFVDWLRRKNPRSVRVCAFLDKPGRRQVPFAADYVGFSIEDAFVVGYGMDCNERHRQLPEVRVLGENAGGTETP